MNNAKIIDTYKDAIVQIATPFGTGTGFILNEYNLIVTNDHVIKGNQEVIIEGINFPKQMTKVLYIDALYDIAFLQVPAEVKVEDISLSEENLVAGDHIIAIGHPFGLKYTATKGIVSNAEHYSGDKKYIQHDAALNPGNSGGPLVDFKGKVVGLNTFIIKEGDNLGFSLPADKIKEILKDYTQPQKDSTAVRCTSCANIVFAGENEGKYCPHCGSKIEMIEEIKPYKASGIQKNIEEMIEYSGHAVNLARKGPNSWTLEHGTAQINITYYQQNGVILGDAILCSLPKKNIKPLYEYLLKLNYQIKGLTFSLYGQEIILSMLAYDKYIKVDTAKTLLKKFVMKADKYDEILINEYGAIPKVRK